MRRTCLTGSRIGGTAGRQAVRLAKKSPAPPAVRPWR